MFEFSLVEFLINETAGVKWLAMLLLKEYLKFFSPRESA
jgi:hypothetical protein